MSAELLDEAITIAIPPSEFHPGDRSPSTSTQSPTDTAEAPTMRELLTGAALRNISFSATRCDNKCSFNLSSQMSW